MCFSYLAVYDRFPVNAISTAVAITKNGHCSVWGAYMSSRCMCVCLCVREKGWKETDRMYSRNKETTALISSILRHQEDKGGMLD